MADKKDYYEQLGVSRDATDAQLKSAYRKLAKQYHPDANPGDVAAEAKFKEISEAYGILSDATKRKNYDQFGHAAFEQGGAGGFNGMDFSDIFSSVFGGGSGFGDMDFFGGGGRSRPRPRRGNDLQMRLNIKFEEAVFGCVRDVQLQSYDQCPTCKGSGCKEGTYAESCKKCGGTGSERITQQSMLGMMTRVVPCSACKGEGKIIKDPCLTCRGQGRVKTTKTIEVTVPKGIDTGQSIRLQGKGETGEKGAPAGDLYITVNVSPHKVFSREGNNLYMDRTITFVQATLGDDITIPMLDGTIENYQLKAGMQPGTQVAFRGKGIPNVHNPKMFGDLIVKFNVSVPTALNEKQKESLRAFNDVMGDDYVNHEKKWYEKVKDKFK